MFTTEGAEHTEGLGVLLCALWCDRLLLPQISAFFVEASRSRMQRHVERRLVVVAAQLRHLSFLKLSVESNLAQLDRFAERVGDSLGNVGMDDHRPSAEVDGGYICFKPRKPQRDMRWRGNRGLTVSARRRRWGR